MYPPEFQILNVLSSAGATVLGAGYLLCLLYLTYSFFKGEKAGANPWLATGLEWTTQTPPIPEYFTETPVVTEGAYEYSKREIKVA
jgi:cytochrome c oxidase subunit 1